MQLETTDPGFKHAQYSLPCVDQFWPLSLSPNATLSVALRDGDLSIFQVGRTRNRESNKASKQANKRSRGKQKLGTEFCFLRIFLKNAWRRKLNALVFNVFHALFFSNLLIYGKG